MVISSIASWWPWILSPSSWLNFLKLTLPQPWPRSWSRLLLFWLLSLPSHSFYFFSLKLIWRTCSEVSSFLLFLSLYGCKECKSCSIVIYSKFLSLQRWLQYAKFFLTKEWIIFSIVLISSNLTPFIFRKIFQFFFELFPM